MSFAPLRFAVVLLAVWLSIAALTLLPGALMLNGHPVDLIQTLDIGYRMVEGDRPHLDFMTPLGVLAFVPVVQFLEAGYGPGKAFLLSQASVALLFLPGIWWVGMSRLSGGARWAFGVGMVILPMALTFGGDNPAIVASMYYNRWAWVLAGFVVLLLMLEPRPGWRAWWLDGLILGASGATLLALKATFALGLLPFAVVAVLAGRRWMALACGLIGAAAVMGAVTWGFGADHWRAYLGDLLTVSATSLRAYPGEDLSGIVSAPAHLAGTLLLLVTIIYLRRIGQDRAGLLLLLLGPGVVYITYQNWGNDPKWLFFLALLLPMLPPQKEAPVLGQPPAGLGKVLSLVAVVIFAPSLMNIAASPLRHLSQQAEDYTPIFADLSRADVMVLRSVAYGPKAEVALTGFSQPAEEDEEEEKEKAEPVLFLGEELPACTLRFGVIGWTERVAAQLGAVEEAVGRPVLVADVYDYLWLFGPFERLRGMATWYYGGDAGFDDAEYVMVPFCPLIANARNSKLKVIAEKGWVLEEVIRSDLFILARRAG